MSSNVEEVGFRVVQSEWYFTFQEIAVLVEFPNNLL